MSEPLVVDLFVEDRAQEEFLRPLVRRLGREASRQVDVRVRAARGGHPRALEELRLYQQWVVDGIAGLTRPDALVVAIDANCRSFAGTRRTIEGALGAESRSIALIACPDPHIERWYMADPASFVAVVGVEPRLGKRKCDRDRYKRSLRDTVRRAGHPALLGGVEFAADIVDAMDLYRAGRREHSLKHFLDGFRAQLRGHP